MSRWRLALPYTLESPRSGPLIRGCPAAYARGREMVVRGRAEEMVDRVPGRRLLTIVAGTLTVLGFGLVPASGSSSSTVDPGIGNVSQGVQFDQAYAKSFSTHAVTNVFVTSQQVSCYRPEVPYSANNGPNDGYTGQSPCPGATTGEDTGATHLSRPRSEAIRPIRLLNRCW